MRGEPERFCFETEIRVFRDQYDRPSLLLSLEQKSDSKYTMVLIVLEKCDSQSFIRSFAKHDSNRTETWSKTCTIGRKYIASQLVKNSQKSSRLEVDVLVPFLELVKLLKDCNRYRDVVFLETTNALGIVQNNVGVDDKELGDFWRQLILIPNTNEVFEC